MVYGLEFSQLLGPKLVKKELIKGAIQSRNLPTRSNDAVAEKFRPEKKERLQRTVVIDRPLIPDSRKFCYRNFDEVAKRAKKLVLRDWNLICSESKIQISKYSRLSLLRTPSGPKCCVRKSESP